MKFPMDAQQIINQYEKENEKKAKPSTFYLLSVMVEVLNKTYEKGKSGEWQNTFPINKDKIPEVVNLMFNEYPTDSKNAAELKEWFIYFLNLGNDVYKQGQVDGYNKALNEAATNCKLG